MTSFFFTPVTSPTSSHESLFVQSSGRLTFLAWLRLHQLLDRSSILLTLDTADVRRPRCQWRVVGALNHIALRLPFL